MKLKRCLEGISVESFRGDPNVDITGIAYDSRRVKKGFLFVALKGFSQDGHDFIADAVENGAKAVVIEDVERFPAPMQDTYRGQDHDVSVIKVKNSRKVLSGIAVNFYEYPFRDIDLIGITGTNGKTTTSYLLESILRCAGANPGVIGTINYRFAGNSVEATVTTPESVDLIRILDEMSKADVSDVIIEVSSHALDQGRISACPIKVAVFTNLTRDHLDYHGSIENYFKAKSRLFTGDCRPWRSPSVAVINIDNPWGKTLAGLTPASCITYGLGLSCDVRAEEVEQGPDGIRARLVTPYGTTLLKSSLVGLFNIYNILASAAAAIALGIDIKTIAKGISLLEGVPGRMQLIKNRRSLPVIVDYAHTPDALTKVIAAAREIVKGRLITVFGCGGDRDMGKRVEMGYVAGKMSDLVVVTSDNPRTEDPKIIASQIVEGIQQSGMHRLDQLVPNKSRGFLVNLNRAAAIRMAVNMADKTDLVLIAGKGHETYQIIGNKRYPFDDRKEVLCALEKGLQ